ncbi:MAG TPA: flagellar motor protein MotD [Rhodocyclaceae bacterium]|nr:flagellar motor protein MotD [Rhodocyclaceae bacterium]
MSRRRRHHDEHENHERWLVSYADFITLLFAFFVVMYSLSSINEGKYRVLSDSLVSAFRNVTINDSGQQMIVSPMAAPAARMVPTPIVRPPADDAAEARRSEQVRQMHDMAANIRRVLEPLTRSGQVTVTEGAHGISVEINASVLFAAGEALLGPSAEAPLRAVARVLADADFPVRIEGHTDDVPINTFRFPSNWELSSARASSVVRLFVEAGVAAGRLTAAGYADQRPLADNATEAGRARNRRVTILIESMFAEPPVPAAPGTIRPGDPIRSILPSADGSPA